MLGRAAQVRRYGRQCRAASPWARAVRHDRHRRLLRYESLEDRRLLSVGVSGMVWSDLDQDGLRAAGEPGLAGAVVEIHSSADSTIGNTDDVLHGVAVTEADGSYAFSGLPEEAGYYEVFRTPVGYAFTSQDVGGDDTTDSDADSTGTTAIFTIPAGGNDTTRDAGLVGTAPAFGFALRIGATDSDYGEAVATDATGNVYMAGDFEGTVDFDPGPGACNLADAGDGDIFVAKYSSAGALVWARRMGGTWFDHALGVTVASDGSVYTTGSFFGTADFDPGAGTFNLTSSDRGIFVSKLDSLGNFVWARHMSGTRRSSCGIDIAVAADGSVYTTGYFQDTVDFDPGDGVFNVSATGSTDIFISNLNP